MADTIGKSIIMAFESVNNENKFNVSKKPSTINYESPVTNNINAFVSTNTKQNTPPTAAALDVDVDVDVDVNAHSDDPHPAPPAAPSAAPLPALPAPTQIVSQFVTETELTTGENRITSPVSTNLDIVVNRVEENAGSEETIIVYHDDSDKIKRSRGGEKNKARKKDKDKDKLSHDSVDRFNKLNDTVVKVDEEEMFKRMTSKGTVVLHHRRATQRHFKGNESIGMNEIIMPYDSKYGVRRFESVPGLRMTSIPFSDVSELSHDYKTPILSVARGIKSIEFDEGDAKDDEKGDEKGDDETGRKKVSKRVNVTIIPGCKWIEKKKDEKSGKLVLPKDFNNYEMAIDYATKSKLGYYGVKFVLENDNTRIKLPFDSTIAEYSYSHDYLNKYVLKNGTGIEMHAFPHFDRPLSENNGFFIFGKQVNIDESSNTFDLHLTAFKIPKKCFVFVPPFVIHSNDYFLGKWTTLLSWHQDINHVVFDDSNVENKQSKSDIFRWQFVESQNKTSPFFKHIAV